MSSGLALVSGVAIGMAAGAALVPVTRRELAAAVARSSDTADETAPSVVPWHRLALVLASGMLPGLVLARAGWSVIALPPLFLLLGLVPLAYCDLTQLLLPKTMVHATTALVAVNLLVATAATGQWHRGIAAVLCALGLFAVLLAINMVNPAWIAFGDVRLAPAIGLGLAWISPLALLQGFFLANLLAAVVGLVLMIGNRAGRKTVLPFGLFLALASAVVVFAWS